MVAGKVTDLSDIKVFPSPNLQVLELSSTASEKFLPVNVLR